MKKTLKLSLIITAALTVLCYAVNLLDYALTKDIVGFTYQGGEITQTELMGLMASWVCPETTIDDPVKQYHYLSFDPGRFIIGALALFAVVFVITAVIRLLSGSAGSDD